MRSSQLRMIAIAVAIAIAAFAKYVGGLHENVRHPEPRPSTPVEAPAPAPPSPTEEPPAPAPSSGSRSLSVASAFASERSHVWVEGSGTVEAVLRDDNEGSRHQKFIVRLSREQTVLISHNIDIARRVPVDKGDEISFRGEYIWNSKGGIVHWTHHDPGGKKPGGWLRIGNNQYD